jgi:glycosyltransferase involved in cell wall biosynthesis
MQVPWYWIKQRPHFIAEGLVDEYEVTVVDRKEYTKDVSNPTNMKLYHRFRLPFERYRAIEVLNNILYRLQFFFLKRDKDIVWITNPTQYKLIGQCPHKRLVYDCMDDMPALAKTERARKETEVYEKKLLNDADVVFASSNHLKSHLFEKYGHRNITVVNNAITDRIIEYKKDSQGSFSIKLPPDKKNLTYIGTLSSWFDYDLVINVLDKHPELQLNLFGPCEIQVPSHPQIKYYGSIEHKFILELMEQSDILVMPFVVNDLIRSVNPVKLYEYIYSGKPCIAPRYGETEQFSNFVNLYNNPEEFEKIIVDIVNGVNKQKPIEQCEAFALQNTWSARVKQMKQILINE